MQRPENIHGALRQLHRLTMGIALDVKRYMDDDQMQYDAEYFKDVEAAALDAHMLTTWIEDYLEELLQR